MSNIKKSLSSELNNNQSKKINNPIKNFFNNLFKPFDEDKEEMTLELSKKLLKIYQQKIIHQVVQMIKLKII